jgi:DNA polymerase III epsilon subunit-like protein
MSRRSAAQEALWGGLRVVVIDLETTASPGGGTDRALQFAAVTCLGGTLRGRWETYINPGVPVSRASRAVHGIHDQHLVGEPMFADVASEIVPLFEQADGERLVIAGHYVGYDLTVLRSELRRVGVELPEAAVLDTSGRLCALVGVRPERRSLAALIDELGIINAHPHRALSDATACAEALVEMLDRAAALGHTDIDALLEEVSGGATTRTVKARARTGTRERPEAPVLPVEHMEGHTLVLSRRAGVRLFAKWRAQAAGCAHLRCRHLADLVAAAQAPGDKVLGELRSLVEELAAAGDTAGTATVMGATVQLFDHLPQTKGRLGFRNGALKWADGLAHELDPLGRCAGTDLCPLCRDQLPCPLDAWYEELGVRALGDPARFAAGFFETKGRDAGTGVYSTWSSTGVDQRIAAAAMAACVRHWDDVSQTVRAGQVAAGAVAAGCYHPEVAEHHAADVAAAGRVADLTTAVSVCDAALAHRAGSTLEAWTSLETRRALLAGRVQRLAFRHSGTYDEDGNPVPVRRHHPEAPRRSRRPRFLRA